MASAAEQGARVVVLLAILAPEIMGAGSAALPPEPHLSCGGNYGWMKTENSWSHKACPPPQWEPVWELNRSTTPWTPWGPESADAGEDGKLFGAINASRWPRDANPGPPAGAVSPGWPPWPRDCIGF